MRRNQFSWIKHCEEQHRCDRWPLRNEIQTTVATPPACYDSTSSYLDIRSTDHCRMVCYCTLITTQAVRHRRARIFVRLSPRNSPCARHNWPLRPCTRSLYELPLPTSRTSHRCHRSGLARRADRDCRYRSACGTRCTERTNIAVLSAHRCHRQPRRFPLRLEHVVDHVIDTDIIHPGRADRRRHDARYDPAESSAL